MEIYRVEKDVPNWLYKAYDYVRTDAFCFGQNIPIEAEFSHDGAQTDLHAIVLVEDHKPVAGCRISYPKEGVGKIERVCVVREKQKTDTEAWLSGRRRSGLPKRDKTHCYQQSGQGGGILS